MQYQERFSETHAAEMYDALLTQIGGARRRVWLTIGYFVPDPGIKQALIQAAGR